MADNFIIEANHGSETVLLGRGILSTLFSVESYGEGETLIKLETSDPYDQEAYIVKQPLSQVRETLKSGLD